MKAVAIPHTGGDWWPGMQLGQSPEPVSLRILEYSNWTRQDDAIARAQEIMDAGFSMGRGSTENATVNSGGTENMKSVDQNRSGVSRLVPGQFMGLAQCRAAPPFRRNDPSEEFQQMLTVRRSYSSARDAIREMMFVSHGISYMKGWWHDKDTGDLLDAAYQVPVKIALIHSEISEAMEADRKGEMDDKLTHRPGIEVELADALHRIFDLAAALNLDLGGAYVEKAVFNAHRADHKIENRAAAGGKAY